ncbi:MAG: hypothetical protein WKG01_04095 [Kofleriaceae bacterium]
MTEDPRIRTTRRRLGLLGPIIVGLGAAISAIGIWWFVNHRPAAGAEIDRVALDPVTSLVIREERSSDRAFVELVRDGKLMWQALIPPYGGRRGASGIAWNADVVTVRVLRDRRAELFVLTIRDAAKLASIKLAPDHGPAIKATSGPVTLTDRVHSFELVSGTEGPGATPWNHLVVLDLATGHALWKQELGAQPVDAAGVEGDEIWVRQGTRTRRFRTRDGVAQGPQNPA